MTEPPASLPEPHRYPARALASLQLVGLCLSLGTLALSLAGALPLPANLLPLTVRLTALNAGGLVVCYAVGRAGRFHLSAFLTVGLSLAGALIGAIGNPASILAPAFVIVGGLIGGLFLSTFLTIVVFAVTIVLLSIAAPAIPSLTGDTYLTTILFVAVVAGIMSIASLQRENRDAQSRAQAATLADRQQRLEEALRAGQVANQEMNRSLRELQRIQAESALLSEWSEMIHTSAAPSDALPVIEHFAQRLFPRIDGAVYLYDPSGNDLKLQASWGDHQPTLRFTPEACWALRRGQIHRVGGHDRSGPVCDHLSQAAGRPTVCAPLNAHGELIGLLSLRLDAQAEADALRIAVLAEETSRRVAVALANLQLREFLRNQSLRDPMTDLFNRRVMEEMLLREIRRSERSQLSFSLLMLDLDHFKPFNDDHGHPAGDLLLQHVAELIVSRIRGSDVACRYGGEELVVILVESGLEEALRRAEALRREIGQLRFDYRGALLRPVSCSIGVASFPQHGATPDLLIHAADTALYQAKAAGRDCVRHLPVPDAG